MRRRVLRNVAVSRKRFAAVIGKQCWTKLGDGGWVFRTQWRPRLPVPDSPVAAAGCKAAARALAWVTMEGSRAAPPRAIAGADAEMYMVGALKGQRCVIGHTRAFLRRATNFFLLEPDHGCAGD